MAVQWLRPQASNAGCMGSIPGRGTRIPHAMQCGQENKKKERKKQDLSSANTMENEGRNIMSLTTPTSVIERTALRCPYMWACASHYWGEGTRDMHDISCTQRRYSSGWEHKCLLLASASITETDPKPKSCWEVQCWYTSHFAYCQIYNLLLQSFIHMRVTDFFSSGKNTRYWINHLNNFLKFF